MEHALLSIVLLQDEFLSVTMRHYRKNVEEANGNGTYTDTYKTSSSSTLANGTNRLPDDRLAVLAIAYHNLGVEFEHLKRVNYQFLNKLKFDCKNI
jgi:hypothetical protein